VVTSARHRWTITPRQAIAVQERLRGLVETADRLGPVRQVAGIDVGFEDEGATTRAAVAVLSFPDLTLVDTAVVRAPTRFPYVPGLLTFREGPAVLRALHKLAVSPDLILYDGQGMAHPRRFGIASHIGVLTDIPSVGVAKTRLVGTFREPPDHKGGWSALMDHNETIGAVLRTRQGVKPLFVSVGHRVCLTTAIRFVMACVTRFRLPETTRWAHRLASGWVPPANVGGALRQRR
jgi:deoxyribonuclease V